MSNTDSKGIIKITNIILDVLIFLFGIILLITIYNAIQVKVLKNDYSNFFGYSVFEVETGSMRDKINPGDWIIIHSDVDYKIDDIVTYKQDDSFITHRIVETYKQTYITKGDANPSKDDPIGKEQVIGKVVKILPHFGILRKTIFNPFVLITLILTIYIIGFIFKKDFKKPIIFEKKEKTVKEKVIKEKKEKPIKEKKEKVVKEKKENKINKVKEKIKEAKEKIKEEVKEEKVEVKEEESKVEEIHVQQVNEEKPVENIEITEEQINNYDPDELDKTLYFRAITVDKDEITNTKEEIKKNVKVEKTVKESKAKVKEVEPELSEDELDKEISIIQKRSTKKFNNIIDKVMFLKSQELNEILTVLNNNEKMLTNESGIKNNFIKNYIDVRYYNYCGDVNASYTTSNMNTKILSTLKDLAEKEITSYKGPDSKYGIKVAKYLSMFVLVAYIDKNEEYDDETFKATYSKKIEKYLTSLISEKELKAILSEVKKIQRKYNQLYKHSLKKLETNTFNLNYDELKTKKNMYILNLEHNIAFSKVYSDYIVDKVYTEDIISEDKVLIELSLASVELVNNMLDANFKNKYMLYLPESIYKKENKLSKVSNVMNDEFIKNSIYVLVHYEDLIKNKKVIKELKKSGYKFAVIFNNTVEVSETNQSILSIADYMFMDKKKTDTNKILSSIHFDTKGKVLYEDLESKLENYGGE